MEDGAITCKEVFSNARLPKKNLKEPTKAKADIVTT